MVVSGTPLNFNRSTSLESADIGQPVWEESLRNGIWPRQSAVWIVAFWLALLIIRPWEQLFPELSPFHVERTYAIIALVAIFLSGQFRYQSSFQTTGLLLWAIGITISSVFAMNSSMAWNQLYLYYTVFVFYIVLLSSIRTPYQLIFLVTCFVFIVAVYLAKSQWEYLVHGGWSFSMGVRRLRGIDIAYSHPNAVAASAVLLLPFQSFLWTARATFMATWPVRWRKLFQWGMIIYLPVAISAVVLTNSRSGMLGVVLAACFWVMERGGIHKFWSRLLLGAVFLACLWGLMPQDSKGRFRNIWDPESGPAAESAHVSGQGRIVGLKQGMEMFRRFPLTGVGLGNFISYRMTYLDGVNLVAHNTIGGVLGETGIVGGVAFLIFVSGVFINCSRTKRLAAQNRVMGVQLMKQLAVACRNSMALILFLGMFGDMQHRPQLYWIAAFGLLAYKFTVTRIEMESTANLQSVATATDGRGDDDNPVIVSY